MRGRFSIIVFVGALVVLLVALNAASYVRVEREAELEFRPDRSTLNAGPSGTRALYEFLEESGRRVMRWREPPAALARAPEGARPSTFVVVGRTRVEFKPEEVRSLLEWVEAGGHLVVIDRTPHASLMEGDVWRVSAQVVSLPQRDVRADDTEVLTTGAPQLAPVQPTLLTRDVASVAPSRYASRLVASRKGEDESAGVQTEGIAPPATSTPAAGEDGSDTAQENAGEDDDATDSGAGANDEVATGESETPPAPSETPDTRTTPDAAPPSAAPPPPPADASAGDETEAGAQSSAPISHLSDERGALLLDFTRGRGRVIVLSDPFIVANRGINRADNLQLAANIVAGAKGDGLIAFDEFHQGRGTTRNRFAAYFAGTPVLAMCAQLFLLAAAVVWTRGRRFARPLPAPRVDRRSKLEFVASMAELQQRARAFDLAIENVYGRTRRALARYGGTDVSAPRAAIAAAVAARSGRSRDEIESLMRECEDAINGAPVTPRQSLALVAGLRELERALGIRMRAREIRQAGRP
ncbi:MAG: DUF4350 domain-containing protein [Acidobacteria bacterium]|nr:DUF4350 domain-containing protein [Acidobacteriota bacterium]